MKILTIEEIIQCVNGKSNITNSNKILFKGVSTDTREDIKGKLYIALEGENFDGHDFIHQAISKGAVAVICHKSQREYFGNLIYVNDTKRALMDIARYYRSLFNVKVVGVTGSVGKTTTKDMICAVLSKKYKILKTEKNLNNEIGVSKTILNLDETYDVLVIEMGMCNFGEISDLTDVVKPDIGIITNIGVSHLEALGSRENIMKAKLEILEGMAPKSLLVINKDNDLLQNYVNEDYKIKSIAIKNEFADVKAENIYCDGLETIFDIIDGKLIIKAKIPCLGEHNVYNALIAYVVGKELEISSDEIVKGMLNFVTSGMRQKLVDFNGASLIEDCYNASPDSMKAAIKTLSEMKTEGKKIIVISDMLELGSISKEAHYNIGKMISESNIDELYCFGSLAKEYVCGAEQNGMSKDKIYFFDSKIDLATSLEKAINKNDVIWFKASRGMKLEEVIQKIYNKAE